MTIKTYEVRRRLLVGSSYREAEELVPEAATWFRVNSFVHTGYLKEYEATEQEYVGAVKKYCPELAEQLASLTGIDASKLTGEKEPNMDDKRHSRTLGLGQDGVTDDAALQKLKEERELSNTKPSEREGVNESYGTPAHIDEVTPDDVHSDGGPTTFTDEEAKRAEEIADIDGLDDDDRDDDGDNDEDEDDSTDTKRSTKPVVGKKPTVRRNTNKK